MLFARASVSHLLAWLKLPLGSRPSTGSLLSTDTHLILPRRSRLFTAAVLIVASVLVFLPQSREATSTIRASWRGFSASRSDLRTLENLGERADKQNDARTLAFVSMLLPNSNRATDFANRAVALDPTLVWIYASRVGRPEFASPPKDGLARLLRSDPDNAVPELLAARVISEPRFQEMISHGSTTGEMVEAALASDPAWIAHMDRAFRASRYESYFGRDWQLTQEVWNHERSLSPSLVFCTLWWHSLPDVLSINAYASLLVRHAREAVAAGHPGQAEDMLQQIDSFGRRLSEQDETNFERLIGLKLSWRAANELRNFYRMAGKQNQSALVARRIEQIDSRREAIVHSFRDTESADYRVFARRAIFVQLSAVFAVALSLVTAFSLLTLELRTEKQVKGRRLLRRGLCFAIDWAPVASLATCIFMLWAFQPFADVLRAAQSAGSASSAWHTTHLEGLFLLSGALAPLFGPFTPYHFWQASTYLLMALALFFFVRGVLRHKPA